MNEPEACRNLQGISCLQIGDPPSRLLLLCGRLGPLGLSPNGRGTLFRKARGAAIHLGAGGGSAGLGTSSLLRRPQDSSMAHCPRRRELPVPPPGEVLERDGCFATATISAPIRNPVSAPAPAGVPLGWIDPYNVAKARCLQLRTEKATDCTIATAANAGTIQWESLYGK